MSEHHKYMRMVDIAERDYSFNRSARSCRKRTVVCVGVKDGKPQIISTNLHSGTCDCFAYIPDPSPTARHAEEPAIALGCDTLYVSYQPCVACANKMIEAGEVREVYYRDPDSKADTTGIDLLRANGVVVSNEWIEK